MTTPPPDPVPRSAPKAGFQRDIVMSLTNSIIFALCQWAVLLVVVRLGTQEQVGYMSLASAIVTPIFVLASMSMREGKSVDVEHAFSDADFLTLRMITLLLAIAAVVGVAVVMLQTGPTALVWVLLATGGLLLVRQQSELMYGFMQAALRIDLMVRANILRSILGAAVFAAMFFATSNLAMAILAQGLIWAGVAATIEASGLRTIGVNRKIGLWRETSWRRQLALIRWLLPQALSGFLRMFSVSLPRLVLAQYVGFAALGVFGATFYVFTASQLIVIAFGQATKSRLAKLYQSGQTSRFLRVSAVLFMLNMVIAAAIVAFGYWFGAAFIRLLFGADYVNEPLIVYVFLAIAVNFVSAFFAVGNDATHNFTFNFWSNLVTLFAAIVLTYTLIPYGDIAAAGLVYLLIGGVRLVLNIVAFGVVVRRMSR